MRQNNPCKNCADRHENCHSKCESYINWKNDREEQKQKLWDARFSDMQAEAHKNETIYRLKRRKR